MSATTNFIDADSSVLDKKLRFVKVKLDQQGKLCDLMWCIVNCNLVKLSLLLYSMQHPE